MNRIIFLKKKNNLNIFFDTGSNKSVIGGNNMGLANQSFDLREDDPLNNSQLNNSRVPLHQPTPTSKPDIIEVQIISIFNFTISIRLIVI